MQEDVHKLYAVAQIGRPNDSNEQYNVGSEYTFLGDFSLRLGYKFAYDAENITAGFGAKLSLAGIEGRVDYGYNNYKWLPGTHAFSLEVTP